MSYLLTQGGSSLYKIDLTTGIATTLSLPSGVTLDTTRKPRFAILNQWVLMTNSPSRNLAIDPEGTVRVMVPQAPTNPPYVAAGSGTGLTGAYQVKVSYVVLNSDGDLLMESPLSPASASFTAANNDLALTHLPISADTITSRRIYRTTAGGSIYYQLMDLDGNVATSVNNGTTDASLSLLPTLSDTLTSPAGTASGIRFKLITQWKSRLWAVADDPTLIDTVYISETNKIYAWPNSITAYPTGQDAQGIIGFAPRRNQLGILKRNGIWQVSGSASGTGVSISNVSVSQIAAGKAGCIAPDTIVVINDKAYWLGTDGVYEWSDQGVINITNDDVAPWFKTDTYFNRSVFGNAFAKYNELRNQYELHIPAAGSSNIDRWVSFNLDNRKWFGPHKTAALTPTHAANLVDTNGLPICLVGGADGVVYQANSSTYTDGSSSAIDFDCYGPFHHGDAPDIQHYWGELSMLSKIQSAGTLTITPYVGRLDATAGSTISHDMTKGRERLQRLGIGAMARLRFQNAVSGQGVAIYGYELPYHELGRR